MNSIESKRPETPIQYLDSIQSNYGKAQHQLSLKEMLEAITEGDFRSLKQLREAIIDENENHQNYFHDKDFLNKNNNKFKALLIRLNYLSACVYENLGGSRIKFVLNLIESLLLINVYHNISPMNVEINDIGRRDGFKYLIFTITKDHTTYNLLLRKDPFKVITNGIQCINSVEQDASLHFLLNEFGISLHHILNNKDLYKANLREIMNRFPAEAQVNAGYKYQPYPRVKPNNQVQGLSQSYIPNQMIRASLQMIPTRPSFTLSERCVIFTGSIPRLIKNFKCFFFIFNACVRKSSHYWTEARIQQVTEAAESCLNAPPIGCKFQVISSIFQLTRPREKDSNAVLYFRENLFKKLLKTEKHFQGDLGLRSLEFTSFYMKFSFNNLRSFYVGLKQLLPLDAIDNRLLEDFKIFLLKNKHLESRTFFEIVRQIIHLFIQFNPDLARKSIHSMLIINAQSRWEWDYLQEILNEVKKLKLYDKVEFFDLLRTTSQNEFLEGKLDPINHLKQLKYLFKYLSFEEKQSELFLELLDQNLKSITLYPSLTEERNRSLRKILFPLLEKIHEKIKENPRLIQKYLNIFIHKITYSSIYSSLFKYMEAIKKEFPNLNNPSLCNRVRHYYGSKGDHSKGLEILLKYLRNKTLEKSNFLDESKDSLLIIGNLIDQLCDETMLNYKKIFTSSLDLTIEFILFMFEAFHATHPDVIYISKESFVKDYSLILIELNIFDRFNEKLEKIKTDEKYNILYPTTENKKPIMEKPKQQISEKDRKKLLANLHSKMKKLGRKRG